MALNAEEEFQLEWLKNHHIEDKDEQMRKEAEAAAAERPAHGTRGRKMRRSPSAWELPMPEDEIDLHGMTADEAAEAVERRWSISGTSSLYWIKTPMMAPCQK